MLVAATAITALALIVWVISSRRREQVTWEGHTYRPGDRVRIKKLAGAKKPSVTGHDVEVESGPGQVGTVLGAFPMSGGRKAVRVRWDAQIWKEWERNKTVQLGSFDDPIHPDYLEPL